MLQADAAPLALAAVGGAFAGKWALRLPCHLLPGCTPGQDACHGALPAFCTLPCLHATPQLLRLYYLPAFFRDRQDFCLVPPPAR